MEWGPVVSSSGEEDGPDLHWAEQARLREPLAPAILVPASSVAAPVLVAPNNPYKDWQLDIDCAQFESDEEPYQQQYKKSKKEVKNERLAKKAIHAHIHAEKSVQLSKGKVVSENAKTSEVFKQTDGQAPEPNESQKSVTVELALGVQDEGHHDKDDDHEGGHEGNTDTGGNQGSDEDKKSEKSEASESKQNQPKRKRRDQCHHVPRKSWDGKVPPRGRLYLLRFIRTRRDAYTAAGEVSPPLIVQPDWLGLQPNGTKIIWTAKDIDKLLMDEDATNAAGEHVNSPDGPGESEV
jgi:hypothetical protein